MNLNQNQTLAIVIGIASFLGGASSQLVTLFGQMVASDIEAGCALLAGITAVVLTVTTGQGSTVKQVLAMPGVEKLTVNGSANQTLSQLAVDPSVNKIAPIPSAEDTVVNTAKGT